MLNLLTTPLKKVTNSQKTALLLATLMIGMTRISSGAALLGDQYAGQDPTTIADWVNAGVTEDLTGAAAFNYNGQPFNISGGLTETATGNFNTYFGNAYGNSSTGNTFLNGYAYGSGPVNISVGGFANSSGVANTFTTDGSPGSGFAGAGGNTFTLLANQSYKLYLFGTGNANTQNASFTFGGITKTTSSVIPGATNSHFVTYDLTTPTNLAGYTLNFSWGAGITGGDGDGHYNGFALVAVSAPSGYASWAATNAPGQTAAEDFDSDGVRNGVEYVLGGTKDTNDFGSLPQITAPGGNLIFTFQRDQKTTDVLTQIEVGTTLGTWPTVLTVLPNTQTQPTGVTVVNNLSNPGFDTVTLTVPQAPDTKKFVRLKITVP